MTIRSRGSVYATANINAGTLSITAGSDFVLSYVDALVNAGDNPGTHFQTVANKTQTDKVDLTANADSGAAAGSVAKLLANALAAPSSVSQNIVAGNNVYISAKYLNISGIVQSGVPNQSVTLDSGDLSAINAAKTAYTQWRTGQQGSARQTVAANGLSTDDYNYFRLPGGSGDTIGAWFNVEQNRIELDSVRVQGGYMELFGHILSTGNGKLNVLDGYGQIHITNTTTYNLLTNVLDSGQNAHGLLKITDTSVVNGSGVPQVTEYYRDGGIVKKRTYWLVRPDATPAYTFDGSAGGAARTATYTPVAGYRYFWQTGQNFTLRTSTTYANSEWLGIDALAKDPSNIVDGPNRENLDAVPLREGEYIAYDPAVTDDYTYSFKNIDVGTPTTIDQTWSTSTWYGTTTYYDKQTITQDKKDIHTHSVRANRDIGIEFTGYDANNANVDVTVNSPNSTVQINNAIHNSAGQTTVTAGGQIQELNADAVVGGHSIALAAQTGIGGPNTLRTDLTDGGGGVLNATATTGDIKLAEISGEMKVNQVTTSATHGDVVLTSQLDITPSGSGNLVRGGAITLTALYGAIGTLGAAGKASAPGSGAQALNLHSGTAARDKITVVASNDVYLAETGTDMQINSIVTGGDVRVEAPNGNVIDDNSVEVIDTRTAQQLLDLYDRMMATPGTVAQSLADTTAAYEGLKTRDYQAYWQYRNGQTSDYVGGLTNGQTYYVVSVSGNLITLASSLGGPAISVTASAVSGAAHRLYKSGSATALTFNSVTDVNSGTGTIQLAAGHGLIVGNAVTYYRVVMYNASYHVTLAGAQRDAFVAYYTAQGTALGKTGADLTDYVNNAITTLENKQTQEYHTLHDTYGAIGNVQHPGSMGYDANIYDANFAYAVNDVALHSRFGSSAVNVATDSIGVGVNVFTNGQAVTYHNGGGTSIPGLTDGTLYYVVTISGDPLHIKLAATQADANATTPVVIDLTAGGSGTGHYFSDGDDLLQRAAWSQSQLQNSVSASVLRPKTVPSTSVTVEDPNISGHDIAVIAASGSIGLAGDPIDIQLPLTVSLTDAQKLALAGAERQDVKFYSDLAGTIEIQPDDLTQTAKLIRVTQTKDLDVTSTGVISATAGLNANFGSEQDMTFDQIAAGGEVRIKGRTSLINGRMNGGDPANIKGGDIIIEGGTGSIGASGHAVVIQLTAGKKFTARSGNDIYVVEHGGDMTIGEVFCTNIADLRSDGSILDGYNDDATTADWNVDARLIYLQAGNGGTIGASGHVLEIDQQTGQPLTALAGQSIFLHEVAGDMVVDQVKSTHGDVSLAAQVSILDGDSGAPAPDVLGNSITLTAIGGAIGSGSRDLFIDSQYSATRKTHALTSSSEFNTYVSETSGSLYLNTVTVSAGTAFIAALAGDILNSDISASNVLSGKTYLFASQNISEATAPIATTVGHIEGLSSAGSTWVSNQGALTVGGVTPNANGMEAGGGITISAASPVTVDKDMIAAGAIVIVAVDDSPNDDLTVLDGITVQSTGSYVRLLAGDNLIVQPDAVILAADYVEMYVDWQGDELGNPPAPGCVNSDPLGGVMTITGTVTSGVRIDMRGDDQADTFDVWGHINAPNVNIYGQGGDDLILLNPTNGNGYVLDLVGHVHVYGGAGHDVITVNPIASLTTTHSGQRDTIDIDGGDDGDDVIVNVTGGVTDYVVNFFDTGATGTDTLTVNGTDLADNFLLRASKDDYPTGVAFVAALHGDPVAFAERVNYNKNLEQLVVDAGGGDDQVALDDNWAPTTIYGGTGVDHFQIGQIFKSPRDATAGIAPSDLFATTLTTRGYISNGISYETTIYGDAGNDDFVVFHNAAALHLFGGDGDDTFTIRAFALEGSHTTDVTGQGGNDFVQYVINAPVNVDGGAGNNTVRIIGTEFSDQFVITSTAVDGAGVSVSYVNISTLEIDAAEGNDTFYVLSTSASVLTKLYGGLGSDRFVIAGDVPDLMSGATIIFPATAGPHTTDGIAGDLTIDGGPLTGTAGGLGTPAMLPGETNVLPTIGAVLGYTGTGLAGTTDTMVVPTAPLDAVVVALGLSSLADLVGKTVEIGGGPGIGRFWLITALAVDGSDPTRTTLTLKNPGQPAAEWGLPDNTSLFAITHLSSNFFVTESEQVDFATIYNDASTTDDTGTLTATQLTGLNMGASGIVYANFEGLDIFLGSGSDTFNITGTMKRGGGFQTVTMLSTGGGDDNVTIALTAGVDGFFSVNGEAGNDTIDGSASTLPLVIFGGPGDDTLTGGAGNDIIFGDSGRVDYRDTAGTLITRLGLGLAERTVLQPGQTESSTTDVPFMQTDGVARGPFLATTRDAGVGGSDTIVGNDGNDILFGGAGSDYIGCDSSGTPIGAENGDDLVIGGAAGDNLYGDAGDDVILGDNGSAQFDAAGQFTSVQTTDPTIGDSDTIYGNAGNDVILGGVGDDNLNGDAGDDILLGDNGSAQFDATGQPTSIQTTNPSVGGSDTIHGNAGNDVIIGGAAGDNLYGDDGDDIILGGAGADTLYGEAADLTKVASSGDDIILGDNGRIDYGLVSDPIAGRPDVASVKLSGTSGVLDRIETTDPTDGGDDTIYGNGGNDILVGGTGDDTLYGDTSDTPAASDGSDILLGDFAKIYPSQLWSQNYYAIDTGAGVGAGNDTLYGNGGDDFLMGQQGGDHLYGGGGDDDLTGGSNVIGAADGNDTMDGGDNADVMIGDNGVITRTPQSPVEANDWPTSGFNIPQWQAWPAPFADVKRDVALFDVIDGIGGDDTMSGGAGDDILYGQRGNDTMSGGAGDDEMIGGLGNDTMHGDGGLDFMLGDQGYFVRALNGDGSARVNTDGAFHRDGVLEDVGTITGMIPLDKTALRTFDPQLAAKIAQADLVLVSGTFNGDGSKHLNSDDHAWQTDALLVDLVPANNDTMDGGAGNDFVVGQRGNDTLAGGDGNKLIEGDIALITMPILLGTPPSTAESARDSGNASAVTGTIQAYLNNLTSPHYSTNYFAKSAAAFNDYRRPGSDKIVLSVANDNIVGGAGTNYIIGGGIFLTVPFNATNPTQLVDLGTITMAAYGFQDNRRGCLNYDLRGQGGTQIFANDTILANGTYNIVYGGGGEIAILFGLNPGLLAGQQEIALRFSDCVFLSPSTARRLVDALTRVLLEHESRQSTPPVLYPAGSGSQADLLLKLVDGLHASYGFERSFRICPGSLQGRRFLLSLHRNSLGDRGRLRILDVCRQLAMPADFQQAVDEHLDEANIIHLGFEGHGNHCVYKVYLERGAALRQEAAGTDPSQPRLLHLAFKWDPANSDRRFVTKYVWYPGLTLEQISARLADIFKSHGDEHRESLEITLGLLDVACRRIDAGKILYLEATEDGTPRRSFDINLYEAGLQLQDLHPLLSRMCRRCAIPYEEFHALYDPAKARAFGHISGGIHREREEFFSVYYGVEGRQPALPGRPTPAAEST